jgi:cytochrome c oxidase assembly protein subunit 15
MGRTGLLALTAVFAVYVGGILVAGKGSLTRCLGWPLWGIVPHDLAGWPQIARLGIAALAVLLTAIVIAQAWRAGHSGLRRAGALTGVALATELALSAAISVVGANAALLIFHVAAAAALWALLVVVAVLPALPENYRPGAESTANKPGSPRPLQLGRES